MVMTRSDLEQWQERDRMGQDNERTWTNRLNGGYRNRDDKSARTSPQFLDCGVCRPVITTVLLSHATHVDGGTERLLLFTSTFGKVFRLATIEKPRGGD